MYHLIYEAQPIVPLFYRIMSNYPYPLYRQDNGRTTRTIAPILLAHCSWTINIFTLTLGYTWLTSSTLLTNKGNAFVPKLPLRCKFPVTLPLTEAHKSTLSPFCFKILPFLPKYTHQWTPFSLFGNTQPTTSSSH